MSFLCCAKYFVIIFSCVYWIFGAVIVTGCIWILNDPIFSPVFTQSGEFLKYTVYLILFAGCFNLLSAWLACYGFLKHSTCILCAFVLSLIIVVGCKAAAGTWISFNTDRISDLLMASVKFSIQREYGQISTTTVTFDVIQKNFNCCGAEGPSDWMTSQYNNIGAVGAEEISNIAFSSLNAFYSIPESCCMQEVSDITCEMARKRKLDANLHTGINKEGCVSKLVQIASNNSGIVCVIFIVVISVEIIAIVFSILLCCDKFKKPNKNMINS